MTVLYCPVCGQPMHLYEQEMLRPDRTKYYLVTGECRNPNDTQFYYNTASERTLRDGSFLTQWGVVAKFDLDTGAALPESRAA